MKSIYTGICAGVALTLIFSVHVSFAHVVVSPSTASGGSYQTFSVGVPSERDATTVGLRLVIPEGVESIRPNMKPGWKIDMKKTTVSDKELVTEIVWTGGQVPSGFRDDFIFSAKTPSGGTVIWKAYQTYSNGSIVSWDQAFVPGVTFSHESLLGPYSQTVLSAAAPGSMDHDMHGGGPATSQAGMPISHTLLLPLIAIGISLACYVRVNQKLKL